MYSIKQTNIFSKWLLRLKDNKSKAHIFIRIERLKLGNFGNHKSVGDNVSELRFVVGSGYRVYYHIYGNKIVLLLVGGDKSTQSKDIERAKKILKGLKNG